MSEAIGFPCNCESVCCAHALEGEMCSNSDYGATVQGLGIVCGECAIHYEGFLIPPSTNIMWEILRNFVCERTTTEQVGTMYGYKCKIKNRDGKLYRIEWRKSQDRYFTIRYLEISGQEFTACFSRLAEDARSVWNVDGTWMPSAGEVRAILL